MKKELLFVAVATMSLASCSNSEEYIEYAEPVQIQVTAGIGNPATREGNDGLEQWATGAKIIFSAVSGVPSGVTHSDSYTYELKSGTYHGTFDKTTDGSAFLFDPSETSDVTFSAFSYNTSTAPSISKNTTNSALEISETATDGKLNDLLYASATGNVVNSKVNFEFNHLFSKLTIVIKTASDLTTSSISNLTFSGFAKSATVAVSNGAITAGDANTTGVTVASPNTTDGDSFIVAPSTDKELTIGVTADSHKYSVTIKPTLESGKAYKCTITLSRTGISIGDGSAKDGGDNNDGATIVKWTDGTEITGNAYMSSAN
jgi:hypothetical protein